MRSKIWIACLAAFLVAASAFMLRNSMFDFTRLWKACELLWSGKSPFSLPPIYEYSSAFSPDGGIEPAFFMTPLWLVPYLPFGLFTLETARYLFVGVELLSFLWLAQRLYRLLIEQSRPQSFGVLLVILSAIPLGAIIDSVYWGSSSWVMLLGLMGALSLLERGNLDWVSGLVAFFLGLKPQIGGPILLMFMMWSLRHRRFGFPLGFGVAAVFACVVITSLHPSIWNEYRSMMSSVDVSSFATATLPSFLRIFSKSIFPGWSLFVPIVIVATGCAIAGWRCGPSPRSLQTQISIWIPVLFLCSPYGWAHDSIILAPALVRIAEGILSISENSLRAAFVPAVPFIFGSLVGAWMAAVFKIPNYAFTPYLVCMVLSDILVRKSIHHPKGA